MITDKLETLLLMAVQETGSYDPEVNLPSIEEYLTGREFKDCEKFLGWMKDKKKTFGFGNIQEVWIEWKKGK